MKKTVSSNMTIYEDGNIKWYIIEETEPEYTFNELNATVWRWKLTAKRGDELLYEDWFSHEPNMKDITVLREEIW